MVILNLQQKKIYKIKIVLVKYVFYELTDNILLYSTMIPPPTIYALKSCLNIYIYILKYN